MSEIVHELRSPVFWFGVVFVGLLLNLGAAYLKPLTDRLLGAVSHRWRDRVAVRQKKDEHFVLEMLGDRALAIEVRMDLIRHVIGVWGSLIFVTIIGLGMPVLGLPTVTIDGRFLPSHTPLAVYVLFLVFEIGAAVNMIFSVQLATRLQGFLDAHTLLLKRGRPDVSADSGGATENGQ